MLRYSGWVFAISVLTIIINSQTENNPLITTYAKNVIFGVLCLSVLLPVFLAIKQLHNKSTRQLKVKLFRFLIMTRKYYAISDINNYLLHIGVAGIIIITFFDLIGYSSIEVLTPFIALIISISFYLDLRKRLNFLAKKFWSGLLGKVLLAAMAAFSFTLSTILARRWVFDAINLDPKYFSEYLTAISVFFTPLAYLVLTCLISLIIVIPEMVFFVAIGSLSYIKNTLSKDWLAQMSRFIIRLKTGKHPEQLSSKEKAIVNSQLTFFRGLSSFIFVASLLTISSDTFYLIKGQFDNVLKIGLVSYYYYPKGSAKDINALYYKADEGIESTAIISSNGWRVIKISSP
ncbi:hypothetical protein NG99_11305 [Erwinia typographi]|uniref:Uncharacterized protein n=1 Tax=Erwinia typographi TaxID=371042 RepID=A0A0A3Z800_9GAMM|nr:hypothetical protein [Erwinia typographi]KGT93894.1 hypothetical protein NG99_11305 [Erwinia typographi]